MATKMTSQSNKQYTTIVNPRIDQGCAQYIECLVMADKSSNPITKMYSQYRCNNAFSKMIDECHKQTIQELKDNVQHNDKL